MLLIDCVYGCLVREDLVSSEVVENFTSIPYVRGKLYEDIVTFSDFEKATVYFTFVTSKSWMELQIETIGNLL